jgi:hypothetical protein
MPSHAGGSRRGSEQQPKRVRRSSSGFHIEIPPITAGLDTVDPFCCKNPLNKVEKKFATGQLYCIDLLMFIYAARTEHLVLPSKLAEPGMPSDFHTPEATVILVSEIRDLEDAPGFEHSRPFVRVEGNRTYCLCLPGWRESRQPFGPPVSSYCEKCNKEYRFRVFRPVPLFDRGEDSTTVVEENSENVAAQLSGFSFPQVDCVAAELVD